MRREILLEGYSADEILRLPSEVMAGLVFTGQPLVFKAGSSTILGEFRIEARHVVIELAQIEGGGEGVLITIWSLARRYAQLNKLDAVEWIVHAVACAKPNLKLREVLDRRGFQVREIPGIGPAYYYLDRVVQ